jgi:malonyl-CoA O-methyltransferase
MCFKRASNRADNPYFWGMNTMINKAGHIVIRAFSEKSNSYTTWAGFQKQAASLLSGYLPERVSGPVLEAGAGTGLFTQYLIRKYPYAPILITDASEEMLLACRQELVRLYPGRIINGYDSGPFTTVTANPLSGDGHHNFELSHNGINAEKRPKPELCFFVYNPEKEGAYTFKHDLVVSALTAQWFSDFGRGISALANSVSDGGSIILSYLTRNSFPEWANKCSELDIPFTANRLPDAGSGSDVLGSMGFDVNSKHFKITIGYPSSIDFFRSLKMTGASTQLGGIRNRTTDMKRLLSAMDQSGGRPHQPDNVKITYSLDVITGFKKIKSNRDEQR